MQEDRSDFVNASPVMLVDLSSTLLTESRPPLNTIPEETIFQGQEPASIPTIMIDVVLLFSLFEARTYR